MRVYHYGFFFYVSNFILQLTFKILRDLADEGKCVIVVSHDEIIKDYSDTIYNLNKGILIEREVE